MKKVSNTTVICNVFSYDVDPMYVWVSSHRRGAIQIIVAFEFFSDMYRTLMGFASNTMIMIYTPHYDNDLYLVVDYN